MQQSLIETHLSDTKMETQTMVSPRLVPKRYCFSEAVPAVGTWTWLSTSKVTSLRTSKQHRTC